MIDLQITSDIEFRVYAFPVLLAAGEKWYTEVIVSHGGRDDKSRTEPVFDTQREAIEYGMKYVDVQRTALKDIVEKIKGATSLVNRIEKLEQRNSESE